MLCKMWSLFIWCVVQMILEQSVTILTRQDSDPTDCCCMTNALEALAWPTRYSIFWYNLFLLTVYSSAHIQLTPVNSMRLCSSTARPSSIVVWTAHTRSQCLILAKSSWTKNLSYLRPDSNPNDLQHRPWFLYSDNNGMTRIPQRVNGEQAWLLASWNLYIFCTDKWLIISRKSIPDLWRSLGLKLSSMNLALQSVFLFVADFRVLWMQESLAQLCIPELVLSCTVQYL